MSPTSCRIQILQLYIHLHMAAKYECGEEVTDTQTYLNVQEV